MDQIPNTKQDKKAERKAQKKAAKEAAREKRKSKVKKYDKKNRKSKARKIRRAANDPRVAVEKRLEQKSVKKGMSTRGKVAKEERATRDQVMDRRTMDVIFKWISVGHLKGMGGVIRTGKEANVYLAQGGDGSETEPQVLGDVAVKIFKTTMSEFTNRSEYVEGDYRFRSAHFGAMKNRGKMCAMWAEKEFANLKRVYDSGIPCPRPMHVMKHLLTMELIGKRGIAAPQLREVASQLSPKRIDDAFAQVASMMHVMHHVARLVHGDLSEYNILYMKKQCYMIDVGQSVELTHPRARTFLIRDVINVCDFFQRRRRDAPKKFSRRRFLAFVTKPLEKNELKDEDKILIEEAVREMEINANEEEEKREILRSKKRREYEDEVITKEMELEDKAREEEKRKAKRARLVEIARLRLLYAQAKKAFKRELKREITDEEDDWEDESEFVLDLRKEDEELEEKEEDEEEKEEEKVWYYKFKDISVGMEVRVTDDVEHAKSECKKCTLKASGASTMYWGDRTQKERNRSGAVGKIAVILEKDASDHSVCIEYSEKKKKINAWFPAAALLPIEEEEEEEEEMPEPVYEDEKYELIRLQNQVAKLSAERSSLGSKSKKKRKELTKEIISLEQKILELEEDDDDEEEDDDDEEEDDDEVLEDMRTTLKELQKDFENSESEDARLELETQIKDVQTQINQFLEYKKLESEQERLERDIESMPGKQHKKQRKELEKRIEIIESRMSELEAMNIDEDEEEVLNNEVEDDEEDDDEVLEDMRTTLKELQKDFENADTDDARSELEEQIIDVQTQIDQFREYKKLEAEQEKLEHEIENMPGKQHKKQRKELEKKLEIIESRMAELELMNIDEDDGDDNGDA